MTAGMTLADDYQLLIRELATFKSLSEEEEELIKCSFNRVEVSKNELLIRQGELVNHLYFVNSGYLRAFHIGMNTGEEYTISLIPPGKMVSSYEGFQKGVKAPESIQALSACELIQISKRDYDALYERIKSWPEFCNSFYEEIILSSGERLLDMQRLSARDRYEKLVRKNPDLAMNIPVKYLASYIGVQPQSLSRIRAQRK